MGEIIMCFVISHQSGGSYSSAAILTSTLSSTNLLVGSFEDSPVKPTFECIDDTLIQDMNSSFVLG
jgi:hypothetical protein